ncbi:MAG: site-specific DNA-methyltransferase, partial [Deltaproteobacteria bacterium]|nr:site-specific DNA-methyltransferase [Deltaproteobacteria bacterium]
MNLSDGDKRDILRCLEAGEPLPERYRFLLFAGKREVELVWNGKSAEVCDVVLPFQTIEQVDEPRKEKPGAEDTTGALPGLGWDARGRQLAGWTNKLIWGDNKLILASLKNGPLRADIEKAGGLKLIYIDPPFDVGADFSMNIEIGGDSFTKKPNILEEIAYRDTWGRGADSFISMIYERLILMRDLLAEDGSIYVHCDWRVSGYMRMVLDEVFGKAKFVNEIVWRRRTSKTSPDTNRIENVVDYLLWYSKSTDVKIHFQYTQYGSEEYKKIFNKVDEDGRRYQSTALNAPAFRPTLVYEFMGYQPPKNGWSVTKEVMNQYYREGKLIFPKSKNGRIRRKQYLDEWPGYAVNSLWLDVPVIASQAVERLGYPTQKPESLLERIVKSSSNEGDLVADFFCGSGTTAAVAEKLGRKWIASDLGKFAIHTTRKRMIGVQREMKAAGKDYRAFELLNLGKYERQHYIGVGPGLSPEQQQQQLAAKSADYQSLILRAYAAQPLPNSGAFHGKKAGRMVAIGPINLPVTRLFAEEIILECRKQRITRADILAFEFEMGLFPAITDEAKAKGVDLALKYIPAEVFDKRAVQRGQITFHNVSHIEAQAHVQDRRITVELTDYAVHYSQDADEHTIARLKNGQSRVLAENGQIVKISRDRSGKLHRHPLTEHWTDWVDYWAVDFDFESKPEIIRAENPATGQLEEHWSGNHIFENEWQSFRTRKSRTLDLKSAPHESPPGPRLLAVKVVDIFGNDTMKLLK